jgi:CRISPR/Cas system-associated exonuclease Cas4 (RecB family)
MAQILSERPKADSSLHLSVSKVKTFKDCKAKFRFCYIEKLPRKDWDFHVFGKFLHEVLEIFHGKMIQGSSDPYHVLMTQSFKLASEHFKDKLTPDQRKESIEILTGYLKQLDEQQKAGTLPTWLAVEKDFYINIDDTVLLNGFIDRIQLDTDGVLHVSDYKTTKNKKYLKNDYFQLLTYAYVMCLEDPKIEKVRTSYILLRHNFETIVKDFDRSEIMNIEKTFLEYATNIKDEKLFRANPTPLCDYCDYIESCEDGKRYRTRRNPGAEYGKLDW